MRSWVGKALGVITAGQPTAVSGELAAEEDVPADVDGGCLLQPGWSSGFQ